MHSNHLVTGEPIYNFLLTGYDDQTSIVGTATQKAGVNQYFDTFCPKVISTVHPIHQDSSLPELQRRLIIIEFKKYEPLFISLTESFSCDGLNQHFFDFWKEKTTWIEYLHLKEEIDSWLKDNIGKYSENLLLRKGLSLDMLTTSKITGLFDSISDTVDFYSAYYDDIFSSQGLIEDCLQLYLESLKDDSEVKVDRLKKYVNECKQKGYIDSEISFKRIKEIVCTAFDYKLFHDRLIKR